MIDAKIEIAENIFKNRDKLEKWYCDLAKKVRPPFYSSIDIRDASFKVAPVDANLYPAGFNNICTDDQKAAGPIFAENIKDLEMHLGISQIREILIIPEGNTKNVFYADNLYFLKSILESSGLRVNLGWYPIAGDETEVFNLATSFGETLFAEPISVKEGKICTASSNPDLIVLNNDFSLGYPKLLDGVSQPILPTHLLGWHSRRKSRHFGHYNRLAEEFSTLIGVDPFLLTVNTVEVESVNFDDATSREKMAAESEKMLTSIGEKYKSLGIDDQPAVFIKSNMGTYGMGIMTIRDPDEIRNANRRTKNKMSVGKNKIHIESVVIQEGIPTHFKFDGISAEPVIYLSSHKLIGGFLRTNPERSNMDNLNSKGMVFKKLCTSDLDKLLAPGSKASGEVGDRILELTYGSIARISALAAGFEILESTQQG